MRAVHHPPRIPARVSGSSPDGWQEAIAPERKQEPVDDPQTPEPERKDGEPEESDLQRAFTNARRRSARIADAVRERVADIRDGKQPPGPPDGDA
jgi:hypothetical protein